MHVPAFVATMAILVAVSSGAGVADAAPKSSDDAAIGRAGTFVLNDFPTGFTSEQPPTKSTAVQIREAKSIAGCGPYVSILKAADTGASAQSPQFKDNSRVVGNGVDIFRTPRVASGLLTLYSKPSMVGCLERSLQQQFASDSANVGRIDRVDVKLQRLAISGLGDGSVVYEGTVTVVGTKGESAQLLVGTAMVQVGRAIDLVFYSTSNDPVTEILTPAIDASVTRLRTALAGVST